MSLALPLRWAGPPRALCRKLRRIGKMSKAAAAAPTENRAIGKDAPGAGRLNRLNDAEGIAFAHLYDLDGKHVAHGGKGDEDGLALKAADAIAVAGQCIDGERDDLVFDKRHMRDSPHKKSGRRAALKWQGKLRYCAAFSWLMLARYLLGGTPLLFLNTREK